MIFYKLIIITVTTNPYPLSVASLFFSLYIKNYLQSNNVSSTIIISTIQFFNCILLLLLLMYATYCCKLNEKIFFC